MWMRSIRKGCDTILDKNQKLFLEKVTVCVAKNVGKERAITIIKDSDFITELKEDYRYVMHYEEPEYWAGEILRRSKLI